MTEDNEQLRAAASRLAERLATREGSVLLKQLNLLGSSLAAGAKADAMKGPFWPQMLARLMRMAATRASNLRVASPRRPSPGVGIWKKKTTGRHKGDFERDRDRIHLWRSFADVECIPAKSRRKRVVLFGESVARGMFYDPAFTPAGALQSLLDEYPDGYEVIDLAKSGLMPRDLLGLVGQARAIEPDMIILFAGNNWHYELNRGMANPEDIGALAEAFSRGLDYYKLETDQRHVRGVAERMLSAFAKAADGMGIPGLVIVPEFNLTDWRDDFPLPLLKSGSPEEWHTLRVEAEMACADRRWDEVERLAGRIRSIDAGLNPDSHRLLAQAALARGNLPQARIHFEAARDAAGCIVPYGSPPRCLSVVKEVLRSANTKFGLRVLDLPRVLEREGGLPGRQYFMDYCHMTALGIAVAMREVAQAVTESLVPGGKQKSSSAPNLPSPGPAAAAAAHILAAMHNALLGQSDEIVMHHCREALAIDPTVENMLVNYFCSRISDAPDWLSPSLVNSCVSANARRILGQPGVPSDGKYFPHRLWAVAQELLSQQGREACQRAVMGQVSAKGKARFNLLAHRFRLGMAPANSAGYYVEKNQRSEFRFFGAGVTEWRIHLCCRIPHAPAPSQVLRIYFEGAEIWSGHIGLGWGKIELSLVDGSPEGGARALSLRWPDISGNCAGAWRDAQDSIDGGEVPDIYPNFGEIHTMTLEARQPVPL